MAETPWDVHYMAQPESKRASIASIMMEVGPRSADLIREAFNTGYLKAQREGREALEAEILRSNAHLRRIRLAVGSEC